MPKTKSETTVMCYLHSHQDLLLVGRQVVALGQEDFPKGSFSELPLQHNVVSLDVLDNYDTRLRQNHLQQVFFNGSQNILKNQR